MQECGCLYQRRLRRFVFLRYLNNPVGNDSIDHCVCDSVSGYEGGPTGTEELRERERLPVALAL